MTYLNDDAIRAAMSRHPAGKRPLRLTQRGRDVLAALAMTLVLIGWALLEGLPL